MHANTTYSLLDEEVGIDSAQHHLRDDAASIGSRVYAHFKDSIKSLETCPRELYVNFFLKFCESYGYFAVSQIVVLYLHEEFGVSDVRAGAMYGIWGACITFWGLTISWINDNLGVRNSLLIGFSLSAVSSVVLACATSVSTISLALFVCMPIGTSMGIPMLTVGIKRYTNEQNRGFAFGLYYSVMNIAAFVAGPVVDAFNIGISPLGVRILGRTWSGNRLVIFTTTLTYVASFLVTYAFLREVNVNDTKVYPENQNGSNDSSDSNSSTDTMNHGSNDSSISTSGGNCTLSIDMQSNKDADDLHYTSLGRQIELTHLSSTNSLHPILGTGSVRKRRILSGRSRNNADTVVGASKNAGSSGGSYVAVDREDDDDDDGGGGGGNCMDTNTGTRTSNSISISTVASITSSIASPQHSSSSSSAHRHEAARGIYSTTLPSQQQQQQQQQQLEGEEGEEESRNEEKSAVDREETRDAREEKERALDCQTTAATPTAGGISSTSSTSSSSASAGKSEHCWIICGELLKSPTFWRFAVLTVFLVNLRTVFRHLDATLPTYLVRCFGPRVPKGVIYSINPFIIMWLTPLVAAGTTQYAHFDMIKYGGYFTAISPFFLAISTSIWAVVLFATVLSFGEAIWSPRTYDYTMSVAPEGREASFSALASAPLFAAKVPVGLLSGYLIHTYLPEGEDSDGNKRPQNGRMLWLIIGILTMTSPILITVFERWIREPLPQVAGPAAATTSAGVDDTGTSHDGIAAEDFDPEGANQHNGTSSMSLNPIHSTSALSATISSNRSENHSENIIVTNNASVDNSTYNDGGGSAGGIEMIHRSDNSKQF